MESMRSGERKGLSFMEVLWEKKMGCPFKYKSQDALVKVQFDWGVHVKDLQSKSFLFCCGHIWTVCGDGLHVCMVGQHVWFDVGGVLDPLVHT